MSNYNLYLTLSQKEKCLLQAEARRRELSLTAFVKSLLPVTETENTKPSLFIPANDNAYKIGTKKKCVKAYFTDNEMKAIEHMAKDEPLSRFISRRALQGENVLNIEIEDDDYTFVYSVIEPLYTSIYNYLHNLKSINALDSKVMDDFISELKESNEHLICLTEHFKKNRASLRKTRLNELRKLSNFYLDGYELISVEK